MKRYFLALFLGLVAMARAADSIVYVLDTGATSLTVVNSGSITDSQIITLPVGASQKGKIWFSPSGFFFQRGSESACAAPCSLSFNTEIAKFGYKYEITDSSGNSLNPPVISSVLYLRLTPQPVQTSPFMLPLLLFGRGYTERAQFSIAGGTDVSALRLWVYTYNLRQGALSVLGNTGLEHPFATTPIVNVTSDGSACTITTDRPHGLASSDVVDLRMFRDNPKGTYSFNGLHTVSTVPTTTTFTTPCSFSAGAVQSAFGNQGKTVSKTVYASSEQSMWHGGINGIHQAGEYMVPMGASEFTAGATNTVAFRFNGQSPGDIQTYGLIHGVRVLGWALVQPDKTITQIVVSGGNATATVIAHGYSDGDTVLIQDAPGLRCSLNGLRVITSHTTNDFTFATGCTTPAATYVVPTTAEPKFAAQPTMRAAKSLNAATDFVQRNPATDFPNLGGNSSAGATFFTSGTLKDPLGNATLAKCADCHMKAGVGKDLRIFNYEPTVIRAAVVDRSDDVTAGNNVAAWIATLTPTPATNAKPWNPPYQPGPGLDALTVEDWQAGAGLDRTLAYDNDMERYLCPSGNCDGEPTWAYNSAVNARELPRVLQMPHWNMWLPDIHPLDFYANQLHLDFTSSALWAKYQSYISTLVLPQALASGVNNLVTAWTVSSAFACTNNHYAKVDQEYVQVTGGCGTTSLTVVRAQMGSSAASHSSGAYLSDFTAYENTSFLTTLATTDLINFNVIYSMDQQVGWPGKSGYVNPSQYSVGHYSVIKWVNKTMFDLMTTYKLQDMNDKAEQSYRQSFSLRRINTSDLVSIAVSSNTAIVTTSAAGHSLGVGGHVLVTGGTGGAAAMNGNTYTILTAPTATTFTFATSGVSDGTYNNAGLQYVETGVNARSGPQYTRGWITSSVFCTGPHKCKGGGAVDYLNYANANSDANFCLATSVWYDLANQLTLDNRYSEAGGAVDWQYTFAFNDCLKRLRPAFYQQATWLPFEFQNTLGFDLLQGNNFGRSIMTAARWGNTFSFLYQDLFLSETKKGQIVRAMADLWASIVPQYPTAQWQTFSDTTANNLCPLSTTPNASLGFAQISACWTHHTAWGLRVMNYYGVSGATLTAIKNWANAVFAASGHDFQTDIDTACGFDSGVPPLLRCPPI